MFYRFPKNCKHSRVVSIGNNAANTQLLIEELDEVSTSDARSIKSYLQGGEGYTIFRDLSTRLFLDERIVSVMWADRPNQTINLRPEDGAATDKMCHAVRKQMLKMLKAGVIEWTGFSPPVSPPDKPVKQSTSDTTSKRAKEHPSSGTANKRAKVQQPQQFNNKCK